MVPERYVSDFLRTCHSTAISDWSLSFTSFVLFFVFASHIFGVRSVMGRQDPRTIVTATYVSSTDTAERVDVSSSRSLDRCQGAGGDHQNKPYGSLLCSCNLLPLLTFTPLKEGFRRFAFVTICAFAYSIHSAQMLPCHPNAATLWSNNVRLRSQVVSVI